jgi:hypothetical protein
MPDIRELPTQEPRVETGPTRFDKDWCGLFIRGDNAFGFALSLECLLKVAEKHAAGASEALSLWDCKRLAALLHSTNENTHA